MILQVLLVLFVITLAAVYLRGKYNEQYWKKRGVIFYPRSKSMGIIWDFLTKDRAFFEYFLEIYNKYPNEPAIGLGSLFNPTLYVTDPTNIQHILTTDFNSFNHRRTELNKDDLLAQNLLFINGKKWKVIRQNMSPLFTTSKLKAMYYILDKSARDFIPYIKENPSLMKGNAFNTLSTFCSAAICASVFGINTHSVFDSPFLKIAQKAFTGNWLQHIKFSVSIISSKLIKIFNIKLFAEYEDFFIGAIKQTITQRKSENVKRHDFADLCVTLQQNGTLKDSETGFEVQPTDELLAAQAFFFFNAGVEPTARAIFSALVLLGKHPEILKRCHEEIDDAFEKNDGKIDYDIVAGMNYLDMVMDESMRIYPAVGYLIRQCSKDTTLPVGNIKIDKGTTIFLPVYPIQIDERYYPKPEVFDPNRFSRENKTNTIEKTFLPFGKGNRNCIGMRYAQLQAKAGMIHLLRNFEIKTTHTKGEKIAFGKEIVQVRLTNVDVEFIERKIKKII